MPLLHLLRQNPVIAAVKDNASLQLAIDSEVYFRVVRQYLHHQ